MMKRLSTTPPACFKRWTRKSYGVFASLGRYVKIGVLSVAMSIILLATSDLGAQTVDTLDISRSVNMERVDIAGNKASPTVGAVSQTTLYNRTEAHRAPIQTVESALRLSPSIDIRERGGKSIQTDISIRAGSFDQTMVMLNGINFSDARTGHQTHSLPIDLETVSDIELIDGVCGVGAYAGAINIRTAPLYPTYLRLNLGGGQYGYRHGNLSGALRRGNLSLMTTASVKHSDGYRHNTGFDDLNAYLRANYEDAKSGFIDFQAGYQNRQFGANGFYSLRFPDQFEHTQTTLASVRWVKRLSERAVLNSSLSGRHNTDRFELVMGHPETVPYNYHSSDNIGAEAWCDYTWVAGQSSLGVDYAYNHVYSTVLGQTLTAPHKAAGLRDVYYTRGKGRQTGNIWLRHATQVGIANLSASGGVALTPYGVWPIWSVAAAGQLLPSLSLDIGAARSMRLPTFTDLYYTATGYVGNPDLKPERAITYRTGANFTHARWRVSATCYLRNGSNTIDWVRKGADDDWHSQQITRLSTFGAEFSAVWRNDEDRFLRSATFSYGHASTNKESGGMISKYALDYMRHKASFGLVMGLMRNLSLSATVSYFDRNGNYTDAEARVVDYRPYALTDARLQWERKAWRIYVEATNIASIEYFDYGGLPMPRRWISAGMSFTLLPAK